MEKRIIIVVGMLLLSCGALQSYFVQQVEALPGPPMIVYGSINDTGGKNIPAGISVGAYVHDPIYGDEWFNYTTGLNATQDVAGYGYTYAGVEFRINDSDPSSRAGRLINFYINEELWGNFTFSAGTTRRDITLVDPPEIVTITSAATGIATHSYYVNVTATDLFDTASEMNVKVNWSHGTLSGNTSLSAVGGDYFNGSFVLDGSISNLTYTVWVNDSAGNIASSGPHTITVEDATAPTFDALNTPSSGFASSSFLFNVTVSDDVDAVGDLVVRVNWSHGSLGANFSLSHQGGGVFNGSVILDASTNNLSFTFYVNDTSGNLNSSGPHTATVNDTNVPQIVSIDSASTAVAGALFLFNVTVSDDDDAVGDLVVRVNWSHGSLGANFSLSHQGGGVFTGSVSLDNSTSNLTYTVWVNDTSAKFNSSALQTVTVSDQTDPVSSVVAISEYWLNASDNPLVVSATNSDNIGMKNVSLYYYYSMDNVTFSGPFLFGVDTTPWSTASWSFNFSNSSGFYRFYSIAIDNASLSEDVPATNDTFCAYDVTAASSVMMNRSTGNYTYFLNASQLVYTTVNTSSESNGSGVYRVGLYYWYMNETNLTGKDNGSWFGPYLFAWNTTPWLDYSNVSWTFTFGNGSGYYRFSSRVEDNASNLESIEPIDTTNDTECYFNNSYPNQPTRVSPTGSSVSRTADLDWTATDPDDGAVLLYDVYFGTDSTPDAGELKASNQTASEYDLGTLSYSTTYYWMIVVWDEHNASNTSEIFSFSTESDSTPSVPSGDTSGGVPFGDMTPPSAPHNVTCTSVIADTTPTFIWDSATDNDEVAGYYVKIDSDSETDVGNVLSWTADALGDGSYVFYVRAKDVNGNFGPYANCSFDVDSSAAASMIPVADVGGLYAGYMTFESILFTGANSTDPDGTITNYTWDFDDGSMGYGVAVDHVYNLSGPYNVTLTVTDNDGLSDNESVTVIILLDTDGDGWSDELENAYGTAVNNSNQSPLDTDQDGIPDEDSLDGSILGDPDDDGDGVPDIIEDQLGSNKKNQTDVEEIEIDGIVYYLIDTNGDMIFDSIYVDEDTQARLQYQDGAYLIDMDDDGIWDYEYDYALGIIEPYVPDSAEFPWWMVVIALIAAGIIGLVFFLFKKGYLILEDDE